MIQRTRLRYHFSEKSGDLSPMRPDRVRGPCESNPVTQTLPAERQFPGSEGAKLALCTKTESLRVEEKARRSLADDLKGEQPEVALVIQ